MIAMWSPGDDSGILYTWVEWIRTGDFLADIGLLADDMHSIQYVSLSPLPLSLMQSSRPQNPASIPTAPPHPPPRLSLVDQIRRVCTRFLSVRNMFIRA